MENLTRKSLLHVRGKQRKFRAGLFCFAAFTAAAAAGTSLAVGNDMRFIFSQEVGPISPEFLDGIVTPREISRATESAGEECGPGLVGTKTRSRDVITLSDGNITNGAWSSWDVSGCSLAEVSRRTETENGTCASGLLGSTIRTREVAIMSDGSEVPQAWSSWDVSGCYVGEVSRRSESETGTCPTGMLGEAVRTREIVIMSDSTEVPQAWSSWNTSACHVGEVSRRNDTETAACGTGFTGNQSRSRVVVVMSDGSEQPHAWSDWNRSSCAVHNVVVEQRTYKQETLESCGANRYLVRRTAQTRYLWTNGGVTADGWYNASLNQSPAGEGLWGGNLMLAGGGALPSSDPYTCVSGNGTYTRDVREFYDCGAFGQQGYNIRRYTIHTNGSAFSSAIVGSAGCGYY